MSYDLCDLRREKVEVFKKALNYAYLLLKYRPRSSFEIASRLQRKKYPDAVIKEVLSHLENYNYINDAEFARSFVSSCLAKGWGQKKILFKIKKLGIPEDLSRPLLEDREVFKKRLRALADSRIKKYKGPHLYQKLFRFLVSRGYVYSDIHQVLEEMGVDRYTDGTIRF